MLIVTLTGTWILRNTEQLCTKLRFELTLKIIVIFVQMDQSFIELLKKSHEKQDTETTYIAVVHEAHQPGKTHTCCYNITFSSFN